MRFPRGTAIRCEMKKWRDLPHWAWEASYLGSDEYGDWLAQPAGTVYLRPGAEFRSSSDAVTLVPAGPWQATFYAQPGTHPIQVYVDMTTPATWTGALMSAVDLDLDVIRDFDGNVVIDDEDEFAEHQVTLGYPLEIVELTVASCAAVHRDVLNEDRAFNLEVSARWLTRM